MNAARKVRTMCVLGPLVVALAVAPAPPVPTTPAGQAFIAWQAAFNSGDREVYRKFVLAMFPSDLKHLDDEMDFRQQTGGFDLKKIVDSTPTKLDVVVEDRLNEIFAHLTVQVEVSPPHRIVALGLMQISTPPEFAQPHLNESDLITVLREKLANDTAAGLFSGAVLVAKGGTPVFEQAYGLADRERNTPNMLDTRFRVGSMNKMFTAVSIVQLVQAGKVRLDDPLGKYLNDYPNKEIATKVTISELLTHTGGTGDIFGPEFDAHRLELKTPSDYEKLYGTRAPEFAPGSKWEYSNYGFILLGLIVEKVSGESYYDYVRENVYAPAGMTSTGSEPESEAVPNRSVGYTSANGKLEPNTDTLPYRGTSAGGGYSTVGDLLRFATSLQQHRLLNAAYTQLLTSGKVDTPEGRYGFGFSETIANGTHCFGHGGGAPGMNGDLEICPDPGYVVVVLANMDPMAAGRISDFITDRLPADPTHR